MANLADKLTHIARARIERKRNTDQDQRNETRWHRYQMRRIQAGLPMLSEVDRAARLHGLTASLARWQRLTADNVTPEHRDNVTVFTR